MSLVLWDQLADSCRAHPAAVYPDRTVGQSRARRLTPHDDFMVIVSLYAQQLLCSPVLGQPHQDRGCLKFLFANLVWKKGSSGLVYFVFL